MRKYDAARTCALLTDFCYKDQSRTGPEFLNNYFAAANEATRDLYIGRS